MTRIIDRESYASLLAQYQPKVIETEEENEAALILAEELEHRSNRTIEEDTLLELLVTLIEKFEEEHYPLSKGNPHSMLLHLMEARNLSQEDLVGVIGSKEVVSEVVNGERGISKTQADALGEFFNVAPSLFL